MQRFDDRGGIWADRVADREDAEHFAFLAIMRLVADDDDGLTLLFDLRERPLNLPGANAESVREAVIADKICVGALRRPCRCAIGNRRSAQT